MENAKIANISLLDAFKSIFKLIEFQVPVSSGFLVASGQFVLSQCCQFNEDDRVCRNDDYNSS